MYVRLWYPRRILLGRWRPVPTRPRGPLRLSQHLSGLHLLLSRRRIGQGHEDLPGQGGGGGQESVCLHKRRGRSVLSNESHLFNCPTTLHTNAIILVPSTEVCTGAEIRHQSISVGASVRACSRSSGSRSFESFLHLFRFC